VAPSERVGTRRDVAAASYKKGGLAVVAATAVTGPAGRVRIRGPLQDPTVPFTVVPSAVTEVM